MGQRICSIEGCTANVTGRGWCMRHYTRWRFHGDPLGGGPDRGRPAAERFWEKVNKTDDCWVWLSNENGKGYGVFWNGRQGVYAHRFAYELAHGAIPDGLVIDHLCRNPSCVRPSHLEAVPQSVNVTRGMGPQLSVLRWAAITHCRNGHLYTEENTVYDGRTGCRMCKTCRRTSGRESARRRRARERAGDPK